MQNNRLRDKTIRTQKATIPASNKKTVMNNENVPRHYMITPENPQCSGSEERLLLNHNLHSNKSFCVSSDRTFSKKQLNRNLGEHFLLKDVEYSQRIKGYCVAHESGVNCTHGEKNVLMSPENDYSLSDKKRSCNEKYKDKTRYDNSLKNKIKNNNTENYLTSSDKLREDKSTYCRPVLSNYNQQFIYKTIQRNARLKNLVKKLSLARQREKDKVNWNNYINDLKNKHRFNQLNIVLDDEENLPSEVIADYCKTTYSWEQSEFCKKLLQEAHDTSRLKMLQGYYPTGSQDSKYLKLNTDIFCYPTSSLGRFIMLRNQRMGNTLRRNQGQIQSNEHNNISGSFDNKPCLNSQNVRHHKEKNLKSCLVQADNQSCPQFIYRDKGTSRRRDLVKEVSIETSSDREYDYLNCVNNKNNHLNIEHKLECLIENFNSFISQIRSCKCSKCKSVSCKNIGREYDISKATGNDSSGVKRKEVIEVREAAINSSESTVTTSDLSATRARFDKINEILKEDLGNKRDAVGENKVNHSRSVQISIEVPTRDCCVSVTNSLSRSGCGDESLILNQKIQEERIEDPLPRMTIAVNTDPLSFLGLLRFSSDTLRRLLSYMPNFDYISYLSSLHFMQAPRSVDAHYVCKICGADFNSPSKLSDHISGHDTFYKTRDCCVCRHVIEQTRSGIFTCQYCGLQFTRAYCCELHQHSCAKRLGKCHDVSSSLMLLR
ncbi:LOW QUALITY PROTEIN: uncharacterized protein LOC133320279 [Danaus plexippus]|uniref:LOW QUALITY PROTEIN: uncharacterized protein LOC133320279 n=1 Tax=Danaus plexippus TaxID=13037 RepID=UPI002AB15851|nr:LOW QUALITY PROTEIN: uncharacterized protein LOC133320279 [Danaus plexippus]